MSELNLPWLELSIVTPLVGSIVVGRLRDPETARRWSLWFSGIVLALSLGAWLDYIAIGAERARDSGDLLQSVLGREFFVIDQLNAPLLSLTALLFLLTAVVTLSTKIRRFSFAWALASEAIMLATLSCVEPCGIIALLAIGVLPPYVELRARRKPTRVFVLHMALFVALMVIGWAFVEGEGRTAPHSLWAVIPLLAAIFVRSGIVPFHCWMTDLFEHATFGTALLFVTPIVGAYAAARLILPIAPDWVLNGIGHISLVTALYAAGMALVQREARRFFCYLFLSHSALVFVGMETASPIGLTGALCVWLSVGLSLTGFGLTLRALEARHGRLALVDFHGLYEHTPTLAICYLLTGLASVGFPGTFGFLGTEMLMDGAVQAYPYVGVAVVIVAALNGIAVLQTYFVLFTGRRHVSTVSLAMRRREKFAVIVLATLIVGGGLYPQPGVASRHRAAVEILADRAALTPEPTHAPSSNAHARILLWEDAQESSH